MILWSLFAAVVLAAVHILAARLRIRDIIPRSRWLSMAGGISVAYVFVHLLPELALHQRLHTRAYSDDIRTGVDRHVFIFALAGLVAFYGIEGFVSRRTDRGSGSEETGGSSVRVFWLHIAAFAAYNAVIGYFLVQRESGSARSLLLFTIAISMHFIVNDYGLRRQHRNRYARAGRWTLAGGVLGGWALGQVWEMPQLLLSILFGALAGGIVLNVLKEEIPQERQGRFWTFALGAAGYAMVLLVAP